jgi:hypothetical protein
MEHAADPGQVILEEIAALEVVRARTEAQIAARMLDFHAPAAPAGRGACRSASA